MAGGRDPAASEARPTEGPTLGVVVTVFQRSRFYRDALRSIAAQTGRLPDVEVVVVRSPDVTIEVPERFNTRGWSCRIVRCDTVGEGAFLAEGVEATSADVVVPLDDDDLWDSGRLAAVADAFRRFPRAGYYHNGQSFVDSDGAPVPAEVGRRRLRRFSGVRSGGLREVSPELLRRTPSGPARWGSAFNNSSVAIHRPLLADCVEELRSAPGLSDAFLFYAGASGGMNLVFDPAPRTAYRIHAWNRSRGPRTLGPFEVAQRSQTRDGRLASLEAMRRMVRRRNAAWLTERLDRDWAYLDLLEGLREGELDRVRTLRRTVELARYLRYVDPVMNAVLIVTAFGFAAAPGWTHRAYWSGDPPEAVAPASGAGR